jgi:hypothetical protein
MIKQQHPSNNKVFGAPCGWDQAQASCGALPVTIGEYAGQPAVMSYWRPRPDELEALNAGAYVMLVIVGHGMPPVALEVV